MGSGETFLTATSNTAGSESTLGFFAFDPAFTGTWLGAGLIASGLGPLVAAATESSLRRASALIAGMAIATAGVAGLIATAALAPASRTQPTQKPPPTT